MELLYKPNFAETCKAWEHFWHGELYLGRPLIIAQARKVGAAPLDPEDSPHNSRYLREVNGEWDEQLRRIDCWLEKTDFLYESIPYFGPDFGPDQFAAFCGAPIKHSPDSLGTNWVDPIVEDWRTFPVEIKPEHAIWGQVQEYSRMMAEHARGRYLVATIDLHSNADALSALRGPQAFCMDFLDFPDVLEEKMREVRRLFPVVYEALYEAGGMSAETGTIGWTPFWSPGRMATIQCDFICLVSPEASRRFIIPALAEEAAYLDHCVYHLDGPDALLHLDQILDIPDIDVIQWVSGAGQKPMWQWLDVLKQCRAVGKGLQIYGVDCEQAKVLHKELGSEKIAYCLGGSRDELARLADWFVKNT